MFKCAYTAWLDFRNFCICDNRESHVHRPCTCSIFQIINLSQCQAKGKYACLCVEETLPRLARLNTPESKRTPYSPVQRIYPCNSIPSVRDYIGVPSHLNLFFLQLVYNAPAVDAAPHKREYITLLKFPYNLYCGFIVRCCPEYRSKSGHPAINQLDTQCP